MAETPREYVVVDARILDDVLNDLRYLRTYLIYMRNEDRDKMLDSVIERIERSMRAANLQESGGETDVYYLELATMAQVREFVEQALALIQRHTSLEISIVSIHLSKSGPVARWLLELNVRDNGAAEPVVGTITVAVPDWTVPRQFSDDDSTVVDRSDSLVRKLARRIYDAWQSS